MGHLVNTTGILSCVFRIKTPIFLVSRRHILSVILPNISIIGLLSFMTVYSLCYPSASALHLRTTRGRAWASELFMVHGHNFYCVSVRWAQVEKQHQVV